MPWTARRRYVVGYHQHRASGALRGGRAGDGILDGQAHVRLQAQQRRCQLIGSGCGFATRHFIAAYRRRKVLAANTVQCSVPTNQNSARNDARTCRRRTAHRRQSPRSSDPPSRHPLRPTDFVPQPPPCSLSVYQPSRRPRRRVLTQRFQWHLSMKRSSRRGGRVASQSRPSPAHRKKPYPTSLGDPKPNPTKPWGTSSTFMWRIVGL